MLFSLLYKFIQNCIIGSAAKKVNMNKAISDETNIERIEHKSKKNIAIGTILGYIAILISVAYGLFLTPIIIQHVGEENYGIYGLSTSIINLFLMDFGLGQTISTKLAKLRAANDKAGVERFLSGIFKLYLFADIIFVVVILVLFFIAPYTFKSSYTPDQITTLKYMFLIVGGYSLISLPSSVFTGVISTYEKFSMIKTFDIIQKVSYLALSLISIYLGWGVIGIVCVNVASGIFVIILRFIYMRTYLKIRLNLRNGMNRAERKEVISFSWWGFIIALFARLTITITPFILGVVSNAFQVTLFTLVSTMETYIFMFGEAFSGSFMAKIARTEASGSKEEKRAHLQSLVEKVGKLQFCVVSLIIAGFASVGYEFVQVWMFDAATMDHPLVPTPGMSILETYSIIYYSILAISFLNLIDLPQIPLGNAMYLHGHIKPIAINYIIRAVINVGLSFALSSFWGAFGASLAVLIAGLVGALLNNIVYRKYLGISLSHYFLAVYGRSGITALITVGVGLLLHFFVPLDAHMIVKLIVDGGIVVVVYIICTLLISFNAQERRHYMNIIFEILHIKKRYVEIEPKK